MLTTLRQRNFALLWAGGLISMAGDGMLYIGLPIYIYQLTHSTLATSLMFIAETVPRIALGSVAGVFVDRWERKRTMVIANGLLALGLLPQPLLDTHIAMLLARSIMEGTRLGVFEALKDVLPTNHEHRVDAAVEQRSDRLPVDPVALMLQLADLNRLVVDGVPAPEAIESAPHGSG